MDEADHLADRIAIMANGQIHCNGSSLFLKRVYGVGYTFTVSLNIGVKYDEIKDIIDNIVNKNVNDAQLISQSGGEINYRLPFQNSSAFAPMFEKFDDLDINGFNPVNSYGISVTTLEEVFLKIGLSENAGAKAKVAQKQASGRQHSIIPASALNDVEEEEKGNSYVAMTEVTTKADDNNNNNNNDNKDDKYDESEMLSSTDDIFAQPEFKLGIDTNASFIQRICYEIKVFLLHTWCVIFRRFFWLLRDSRNILCQIIIPGGLAAAGLAVIDLAIPGNNPELELTINQWYSPGEYKVPIANTTLFDTDIYPNIENNPLLVNYGSFFTNGYDLYMEDDWGSLKTYDIPTENQTDGTYFSRQLLKDFKKNKIIPYNGFYLPYFQSNSNDTYSDDTRYFMAGFNARYVCMFFYVICM